MTPAQQIESTIFQITINPDPNSSVGPKVGERPFTLCDLYLGAGTSTHTAFEYIQSVLRLVIALTLLLVVFGKRWALCGMWAGITGLIATHYWAHFGNLPVDFTLGRHPLSYLKGFIFPTIITLAFHTSSQVGDSNAAA